MRLLPAAAAPPLKALPCRLPPRQFGVYELLAVRLPDDEEAPLQRFLIEWAADSHRNDLLNRYTVARRRRPSLRHADRAPFPREVAAG